MEIKKTRILFMADDLKICSEEIKALEFMNSVQVTLKSEDDDETFREVDFGNTDILLISITKRVGKASQLLYKLHNHCNLAPYIIVITDLPYHKNIKNIEEQGVGKLFWQLDDNYSAKIVARWVEKIARCFPVKPSLIHKPSNSSRIIRKQYSIWLENIGIYQELRGHKYLLDSIIIALENPDMYLTTTVSEILAKRYSTTVANIDRCMRSAIEIAWRDTNFYTLKKYYLCTKSVYKERPTVSEFVNCMVDNTEYIYDIESD